MEENSDQQLQELRGFEYEQPATSNNGPRKGQCREYSFLCKLEKKNSSNMTVAAELIAGISNRSFICLYYLLS